MEQVEAWIHLREPLLKEKNYGQSIEAVEELLRRHADFEKTVDAQEEKVQALRRLTEVGLIKYQLSFNLNSIFRSE